MILDIDLGIDYEATRYGDLRVQQIRAQISGLSEHQFSHAENGNHTFTSYNCWEKKIR